MNIIYSNNNNSNNTGSIKYSPLDSRPTPLTCQTNRNKLLSSQFHCMIAKKVSILCAERYTSTASKADLFSDQERLLCATSVTVTQGSLSHTKKGNVSQYISYI